MDFGAGDGIRFSDIAIGDFDEASPSAESIGERSFFHQSVEIVTHRSWAEYFHGPHARLRGMRRMSTSTNGVWPNDLNFAENGKGTRGETKALPQIVYRNVCTEEDPPASVAISPTRQCIAFGCKAGVELYWIDPTTGQNLNR